MSIIQLKKNIPLNPADTLWAAYSIVQEFHHNDFLTYSRGYIYLMNAFDLQRISTLRYNLTKERRSRIFESYV